MGTSLYPNQIDNSTSIPIATDGVTAVNAEVVNRLRDAIIAVEVEGGINPSGTYGTIRDRLDALDAIIAGLGGGGGGAISVQDNGSTVVSLASILNFTGTGVTVTSPSTGTAEINITGGSTIAVEDSGVSVDASATLLNFTGDLVATSAGPGLVDVSVVIPASTITVNDDGFLIDGNVTTLDAIGKIGATSVSPGYVELEVPESKIRVYRATSNLAGAAAGADQTVTWNATSTKVTTTNASLVGDTLVPTKSGLYFIQGQLTIQPTVDSISAIIIKIVHNGLTDVHTIYDAGAVWSVGTNRSFNFNFPMELAASDTVEVVWQHLGSALSATDVVFGDDLSWFGITLV